MKRQLTLVALFAAALFAIQAGSAEAKVTKAPSHPAKGSTSVNNVIQKSGVNPVRVLGQTNTNFGGHGPVVPPNGAPPVTWGGNPPRAPKPVCGDHHGCGHHDGCGDHDGCYGHDHHHCRDMFWAEFCFGDMFGACDSNFDDGSADSDFDSCQ